MPPAPGITVTPTLGLVTTEAGGSDAFSLVLDTQPAADVTIDLASSDLSEGTVEPRDAGLHRGGLEPAAAGDRHRRR